MSSFDTVNLGGDFSREDTPEGHIGTHKSSFLHYKEVRMRMVIMDNLEQPIRSYYLIYFEKFRNVMQQTEKEALSTLAPHSPTPFQNIMVHPNCN